MLQQYGFRASLNLTEIVSKDACLDNLGVDRTDLSLLVGTASSGVTAKDYQAIIGLKSNLELQMVPLVSGSTSIITSQSGKASRSGDTFTGSVVAGVIDNDRPYYNSSYSIFGPSTVSYFSPVSVSGFSSGAQYKMGPVYATNTTISGFNFTGSTKSWDNYFVRYKQYAQITQDSTSGIATVPLYLAPPSSLSSNKVWLDSEYSYLLTDGGGTVILWQDVLGRASAVQSTLANRPVLATNLRNSKPGIVFDGASDFLSLGNLGELFPTAATAIIVATVGSGVTADTDYNIFGTLNNTANRWRTATASGALGMFTSSVQTGFPAPMPASGTFVFTVSASNALGLELRTDSVVTASKYNTPTVQVTYAGGTAYAIGANADGSGGFFGGTIYAIALFDQVLTGKELRSMEEYFAWRFGFVADPDRP